VLWAGAGGPILPGALPRSLAPKAPPGPPSNPLCLVRHSPAGGLTPFVRPAPPATPPLTTLCALPPPPAQPHTQPRPQEDKRRLIDAALAEGGVGGGAARLTADDLMFLFTGSR
jgi:hypothetical protein